MEESFAVPVMVSPGASSPNKWEPLFSGGASSS